MNSLKIQQLLVLLLALMSIFALAQTKLLYTYTLARHGAVYPPNDYYDGNQTKAFRGLLTPIGLRQHYNLGTYLNQMFIQEGKLMNETFNPNEVEFYSTSKQRTQNSALAFIYGLFPLGKGWTIPPEVPEDKLLPPYKPLFPENLKKVIQNRQFALNKGFQPLPVRPLDDILDNCPNYDNLLASRIQQVSKTIQDFSIKHRDLFDRMRILFNLTKDQLTLATMSDLYDTIYADLNLGRAMPSSFGQQDKKNLKYMYQFYNTLLFGGNFARVLATPSLRMIKQKLLDYQKATNTLKASFIFGHHSNVLPLISVFGLTSPECINDKWEGWPVTSPNCVQSPAYAANFITELHYNEDRQAKTVRIRYNGYYINKNSLKEIDFSLDEFIAIVNDRMTNFEEQCKVRIDQREMGKKTINAAET